MSACAAVAAPTRSRATGKGTPTRTARRATRGRSAGWTRECVLEAMRDGATDRPAAVLVRLVCDTRGPTGWRGLPASRHRRLAVGKRRNGSFWKLGCGAGGRATVVGEGVRQLNRSAQGAGLTDLALSEELLDALADRLADRLMARLGAPSRGLQKTFALVDARGLAAELGSASITCTVIRRSWGRWRLAMARRRG